MKSFTTKLSILALCTFVISSPVQAKHKKETVQMTKGIVQKYKNIKIDFPAGGSYHVYGQKTSPHSENTAWMTSFLTKNGDGTYKFCVNRDQYEYRVESTDGKFKSAHQSKDFAGATTWDVGANQIS